MHSFSSKVMNERRFFGGDAPANYREILADGSMAEKLSNKCVPIRRGFCKEKDSGRETVDAMYDKGSLSGKLQFRGKKGPGGRNTGAFHRHSVKAGGFVERYDGIVFVEHDEFS
jgi:hypothetical protein